MINNLNLIKEKQQYEESIKRNEALQRLKLNDDFKKLFLEDYISTKPVQLAHAIARLNKQELKDGAISALTGVGALIDYMDTIESQGLHAQESLRELETYEAESEMEGNE